MTTTVFSHVKIYELALAIRLKQESHIIDVHKHNLPFPTPKLGSFHHTLILSTSYPRTDMKEEFLQSKAGAMKSQKANPEPTPFAEYPLPLVPSSVYEPKAASQHELLHITRQSIFRYSGPKPWQFYRLPLTSQIPPRYGLEISPNASRLQHGFAGARSQRNLEPSEDSCARSRRTA